MKKGFSLAELLLMIMIMGIILIAGLTIIPLDNSKHNKILLKSLQEKLLPSVIAEILHDNSHLDNTFCDKLKSKLNIIDNAAFSCTTSAIPDVPNFITSNGMRWYGFDANNFSSGNKMTLKVDINGKGKEPNTEGKDIYSIYVCANGTLSLDSGVTCPDITPGDPSTPPVDGSPCTLDSAPGDVMPDGTIKVANFNPDNYWQTCSSGANCHALCVNPVDIPGKTWNNGTANYTTTDISHVADGVSNTNELMTINDAGSPYEAAKACYEYSEYGHDDWYLPAKYEFDLLWDNRSLFGINSTNKYWASTEFSSNRAYINGSNSYASKNSVALVRCFRRD